MRLSDTKPYSRARTAVMLSIYEQAYKFIRLPRSVRDAEHSPKWKEIVYGLQKEMDWGNNEILMFIRLIREHTRKQIRQFLLENGSKVVRKGKRTYIKGKRNK